MRDEGCQAGHQEGTMPKGQNNAKNTETSLEAEEGHLGEEQRGQGGEQQ